MRSSATSPSVLIIGYGNPLRSDDGVGGMIARRLDTILCSSRHDIRHVHQLTPELAEPISRAQMVIFIDAARDAAPGEIRERPVNPVRGSESLGHQVSPEGLLARARDLFVRCPNAYAFAVGGERWGFSESLSPKVSAAVPMVIGRILDLIASVSSRCTN
jgi:hydrogenase maturation protease